MASIEPTDRQGVWRARAHLGRDAAGRQVRPRTTITAPTRGKAQRKADQWENELRASGRTDFTRPTVATVVDEWVQGCESRGLATWTVYKYRRLGEDIKAALGARRVDELSINDVEAFYRGLRRRGVGTGHHHSALRAALQRAVKHGHVARNVAKFADRETQRPKRGNPPTPDQARHLIEVARDLDPVMARLIVVALSTGMRRGELAAMRRSRVDLTKRSYLVDTAVAYVGAERGVELKAPKTHQSRPVAIGPEAVDALLEQAEWLTERARLVGVDLVADPFLWSPAMDCSAPPKPDSFSRGFAAVCRQAGLVGVRFHDLRHATATWLLDRGYALATVSEILRHANPATTAAIYVHGVSETARRAADELGRAFAGELEA